MMFVEDSGLSERAAKIAMPPVNFDAEDRDGVVATAPNLMSPACMPSTNDSMYGSGVLHIDPSVAYKAVKVEGTLGTVYVVVAAALLCIHVDVFAMLPRISSNPSDRASLLHSANLYMIPGRRPTLGTQTTPGTETVC